MRSLVIVTAIVVAVAYVAVRQLPMSEANSDVAVNKPIDKMEQVRSVSFDGYQIPAAELREQIETRPGRQLDSAALDRDRQVIEHELFERGYLAARVSPATVTFDAAGAAYVTFEIDKGRMFRLRNVEVSGAAKDAAVVTIASGDDAIRDRIDHARDALAEALARRGKPGSVELSIHTDLAANAVDVQFATR